MMPQAERRRAPMNRREGLKLGAASLTTSLLPVPTLLAAQTESPPKEKAMADDTAIRPFHFQASQADLADLRQRHMAAPTTACDVKILLANSEPSTHGPSLT